MPDAPAAPAVDRGAAKSRIEIDPNCRVRGNQTFSGFEDVSGPMEVGMEVEVYESEANIVGYGRITDIDHGKRLVYLTVDWGGLHVV